MGRSFLSPAETGVYMSVLLRPQCKPQELMHLTCAAAVAACNAVENAVGFRPGIKWTNDLVYQHRKLAGILTELSIDSKNEIVDYAIIGIGINCTQKAEDFDPTIRDFAGSLSMFAGQSVDRSRLIVCLICAMEKMNAALLSETKNMTAQYRRDCITIGKDISLLRADGSIRHGHAVDVDDAGALLVRFPDGTLESVNSGEVSVRGMYGYI